MFHIVAVIVVLAPIGYTTVAPSFNEVFYSGSPLSWCLSSLSPFPLTQLVLMYSNSYRLGLFGSAASPKLREDNKVAGDSGVGNYGAYPLRPLPNPKSNALHDRSSGSTKSFRLDTPFH